MGSPFPVGPTFANGIDMNAVVFVATCKFNDTARIVGNGIVCRLEAGKAALDYLPIGLQPTFLVQKCKWSRHKKLGLEMESEIREKTFVVFKDHEGLILNYKLKNKKTFPPLYKKSPLPP